MSIHDTPLYMRRNLYVLNLPASLEEQVSCYGPKLMISFEFALLFQPFGDLINVQVLTDKDGRGRKR
jgi:hypothetical protein